MESQTLQVREGEWAVHARPQWSAERRDIPSRRSLVRRVAAEFEEVPGMRLTLGQAARFFGVRPDACSRILSRLLDEGQLQLTLDGQFVSRPMMASRLPPRR